MLNLVKDTFFKNHDWIFFTDYAFCLYVMKLALSMFLKQPITKLNEQGFALKLQGKLGISKSEQGYDKTLGKYWLYRTFEKTWSAKLE